MLRLSVSISILFMICFFSQALAQNCVDQANFDKCIEMFGDSEKACETQFSKIGK